MESNHSMQNRKIKLSLNRRLGMITLSVFLPMFLLTVYLLSTLVTSVNAYNNITQSVGYANRYSKDFKERMDYSMYLAVIAGKSMKELGVDTKTVNGIKTVNPYKYITELESACDSLSDMATVDSNKYQIQRLKKSLKALRNCVKTLEDSIEGGGTYDDNMKMLDNNIYGLTTIIEDGIQDYVYAETLNLDNVRTRLEEDRKRVFFIGIAASIVVGILSLVLSNLAARSVTKPIQDLCKVAGKVAKGDFTIQTDVRSKDEIAVLTESFNDMTTEIGRLVADITKEQENLRLTETKLLQAQINPHFLYNTLDTIVWLAEENKSKDVVAMVTDLSNFFRTTLSEGKDCITVREEQSHIESYLKIQQFRYQDILDYEIHIKEELYPCIIPKLTLQPLVENALYHGIKNRRGKGTICIEGTQSGNKIILRVIDNGKGMDESTLNQLRKSMLGMDGEEDKSGFGLANVNKRIQHYYGKEYGVFFESQEDKGTEATIILGTKIIVPLS